VRVRVFNEMQKPRPQDLGPDETRSPYRVLPKKTSWEEALARFEKTAPPVPEDSGVSEGTTTSRAPL
jgi:hypothetical protein